MIATRQSWGAQHPDGDLDLPCLAEEVTVHHTVTTQLAPTASVTDEQAQMRHLEQIGQDRFGSGISYNVVIFPSGRAYQGVSWDRRGTHTAGHNNVARSIAFAGNYETHQPTQQQIAAAASIYAKGFGLWWTLNAPLIPHCDLKATACPGRNILPHLDQIRGTG